MAADTNHSEDAGGAHFRWLQRFQLLLLPIGGLAWLMKSRVAAGVFLVGGVGSLIFWSLHRFLVGRMLNPKVRLRWFYGALTALKLALIVWLVRGMMGSYPMESLPLATGLMLFVLAILFEALRLIGASFFQSSNDEPR